MLSVSVEVVVVEAAGISLTAGGRLKNRLLRVLSRLLFQEIEESEKGTRLRSPLLLHPSRLLQNLMRTLRQK